MKKCWWILGLFILSACNSHEHQISESDVDAARNFLNAVVKGDFEVARSYMIDDADNNRYLTALQRNWAKFEPAERRGYRDASLTFYTLKKLNDSTTIVPYSVSFTNKKDSVLVKKMPREWLVDLKYTIEPSSLGK